MRRYLWVIVVLCVFGTNKLFGSVALEPPLDQWIWEAELQNLEGELMICPASILLILPVDGRVTSPFGYRRSPFRHVRHARDFHPGLDIAASRGSPIVSSGDGHVIFAGYKAGFGKTVIIDHGFGLSSLYAHASKIFVQKGRWVSRGVVIGLVGNTGHSTGPHVHYEVHEMGVPLDPMRFVYKAS